MIRCAVFDVDGTLYDFASNGILPSTIQAIHQLKEKGILFVIATGRAPYSLGKALNDLEPDYIIGFNGAMVTSRDGEVLYQKSFNQDEFDQLSRFCVEEDAGLIWKFNDHMYCYQNREKVDWLEPQLHSDVGPEPFVFDCFDRHKKDLPISASIHANPKRIQQVFGKSDSIVFHQYSKDGFDAVCKGLDKGSGLLHLMENLHLTADEIVAFGDNYNDLPMMNIATHRAAMGNAVEELKRIATLVTDDCAHDGIYHACLQLGLIDSGK